VTYRKFSAPEVFVIHELKKPKENPMTQNGDENGGEEKEPQKETTEEKLWKDASPEAKEFGFEWRKYKVNTHPVIEKQGDIDGMYLLKSLTDGTRRFQPQPFVLGSRKELEKLVALTIRKFGDVPGVQGEWEGWRDFMAPQSDDALEYCRENPLEIPFWDELFSGSPVDTVTPLRAEKSDKSGNAPAEFETTNSVLWSNRGQRSKYEWNDHETRLA